MKTRFSLILVFLFSLSFLFHNCSSENASSTNSTSEISKMETTSEFAKQNIAPPLESVDVAFKNFEIKNGEAQTFQLENGTSIEIPANAFVDANGQPVTSTVNIGYREFHNAAEILASGIPMKAVHNGQEGIMQTAGMFEIKANVLESEVFLTPGKNVKVNMASNVGGDEYDFWIFNREKGDWANQGASTPQPNPQRQEAQKALVNLAKVQAPTPPVAFDKKKPVLNFELNLEAYPELKDMKNIFWQYTGRGEDPKNAPWIFKEKWTSANVKKGNQPNEFTLVLKNDKRNFSTSVCPSQKGKEFEAAMANYESALKNYKSQALTLEEKRNFMDRQAEFVRSVEIQNMGIFNYDILLKNPDNFLFAANFDFGPDVPPAHNKVNVYLITNDGRSVIAYPYNDRKRFGVNSEVDNRIIAILPNNKIATFSQEDFDANMEDIRDASGKSYTFKMKVQDAPVNSMDDLSKAVAAL